MLPVVISFGILTAWTLPTERLPGVEDPRKFFLDLPPYWKE